MLTSAIQHANRTKKKEEKEEEEVVVVVQDKENKKSMMMMTMKTWNNCIYSICINTLSNVYKYFNKCIDDLILKSLQRNLISIIFPFKPEFCFHWQNNM